MLKCEVLLIRHLLPARFHLCFCMLRGSRLHYCCEDVPSKSCLLDPMPTWMFKNMQDVLIPAISNLCSVTQRCAVLRMTAYGMSRLCYEHDIRPSVRLSVYLA